MSHNTNCQSCDIPRESTKPGICAECKAEGATYRPTNVDFVVDLMESSRFGVLSQAFVIEAISRYAKEVAAAKPEDFAALSGFINPAVWIAIGQDIKAKVDAKGRG